MTAKNCTTKKRGKQPSISVGDVFKLNQGGSCTVIERATNQMVLIQFNDSSAYKTEVFIQNLKNGQVKNPYKPSVCGVGCMGVGSYYSHANGKHTPEYQTWRSMIRRCYDPIVQEKRPTYKGCTVHPDWLNFQTFADWYVNHPYYGMGYELDKDLLYQGNRVYSPTTCTLVPAEINALLNDRLAAKGDTPTGVSYHKKLGRYVAGTRINGKRKHLGYYDCPEKASRAYVLAKKEYIIAKALEWQDRIDKNIFDALILRAMQ